MAINKVEFGGQTLIDLTADTVSEDKLLSGATAHNKAGNKIQGKAQGAKPEQAKTVEITANGDTTITPDVGKVLSSVLAKVNVPTGGGGGVDIAPFTDLKILKWTPAQDTTTWYLPIIGWTLAVIATPSSKDYASNKDEFGLGVIFGSDQENYGDTYFVPSSEAGNVFGMVAGKNLLQQGGDYAKNMTSFSGDSVTTDEKYKFKAGTEYIGAFFFGPEVA